MDETMKLAHDLANAERHATMRAFVAHHRQHALAVPPGDHLLAHARHSDGLTFLDFVGFKDGIPLIGDHICLVSESVL